MKTNSPILALLLLSQLSIADIAESKETPTTDKRAAMVYILTDLDSSNADIKFTKALNWCYQNYYDSCYTDVSTVAILRSFEAKTADERKNIWESFRKNNRRTHTGYFPTLK